MEVNELLVKRVIWVEYVRKFNYGYGIVEGSKYCYFIIYK